MPEDNHLKLQGRVAIITGGGSGFGRQAALTWAAHGAKIVVADYNVTTNEETAQLVSQAGGEVIAVRANVASAEDVAALVETTVKHYGKLDIMFNNAGTGESPQSIVDLSEKEWDLVMNVNAKGVFLGIKYGAKAMIAQKSGVILNTSSVAGLHGYPKHAAYAASKGAVIQLTKTAALELVRYNIRVNAICPGFVKTGIVTQLLNFAPDPVDAEAKLAAVPPMRRLGTIDEIVKTALFLVSDDAAFITGAAIPIDGGIAAQ